MKKTLNPLAKGRILLPTALFLSLIFTSCKKDTFTKEDTGIIPADTTHTIAGIINFINHAPTAIRLTVNGVSSNKSLAPNTSITFSGSPGYEADIIAETIVTDINGNPAGMPVSFHYVVTYPADQTTIDKEINIPPDMYLVNVINLSNGPADQLVVNDAVSGDVVSDITILNNNKKTVCGYYRAEDAMINIKVIKSKGGANEWDFNNLKLPGLPNQVMSVTCY